MSTKLAVEKSFHMTIKMHFAIILVTLITGFTLFGFATFTAMKTLNVNGAIYQRIVQGKDLIADTLPPPEYIIESYLVILQLDHTTNHDEVTTLVNRFNVLKNEYDIRHVYWQDQNLESELTIPLLKNSYNAANNFYVEAQQNFIPNIQAGNQELSSLSLAKLHDSYKQHRIAIDKVVQLATQRNKYDEEQAQLLLGNYNLKLFAIFILSVGTAGLLTVLISTKIIRQLGAEPYEVVELAEKIAEGKLDNHIVIKQDNPNSLISTMKVMQEQISERRAAAKNLKDEILRIKLALDNVSTMVMIADNDLNIIYINKSAVDTLTKNEAEIRQQFPSFNSQKLLRENLDSFHKNPQHQRNMLGSLTTKYKANLTLGGHSMVVFATPVINDEGERLGTVAEWYDYTAEYLVEKEVSEIVDAANLGDFTKRLYLEDKEGILRDLGNGINQLLHTNETNLFEITHVLEALSCSDLTKKITNEYFGTFGRLKEDTNNTVEKIKAIVYQIKTTSDNIGLGAKNIASGNDDLSRRTKEQALNLEKTATRMRELTITVQHNTENAKHANVLAENATQIAEKGSVVVGQVVKKMESINDSSRKVVEIISVIDNIAFQTNILALNAAVEAARAGEQGRGFAVVATEVRNLAQRAAAAAGEIQNLISDSVEKVEDGSLLVTQAGKTMQDIVNSIHGVTSIMANITAASIEQGDGIAKVNQAISEMDNVTQQNATLVEQAASNAEYLKDQAHNLTITVSTFKI